MILLIIFNLKKIIKFNIMSCPNNYWKSKYYELLKNYNYLDSNYKEDKQSFEEITYNLELNLQNVKDENDFMMIENAELENKLDEMNDENQYLHTEVDNLNNKLYYQKKRKCEAREEIINLKKMIIELNKKNDDNNEFDYDKCCNICYENLKCSDKKIFECTNKCCKKKFHISCLLKVKNNINNCSYCKTEFFNYNFNNKYDDELNNLLESDEDEDYNLDFALESLDNLDNISLFKCFNNSNINLLISLQAYLRGFIIRKNLNKKNYKKNNEKYLKKILKAYPDINNRDNKKMNLNIPHYNDY